LMFAGLYAVGGLPWLVWGGFVRSVLVLHTTWLVNSATHVWGYRTYATRDDSTNLWWVALLTFGEGWHNNHHAFPTSARQGLEWWELDLTYAVIRVLSALGLAHSVKLATAKTATPSGDFGFAQQSGEHQHPEVPRTDWKQSGDAVS
jgi:fatty-acid desaturase